jgi:hypothetical protein
MEQVLHLLRKPVSNKIVTDITAHSRIMPDLCVGVCPTRHSDSGTLNFMKLELMPHHVCPRDKIERDLSHGCQQVPGVDHPLLFWLTEPLEGTVQARKFLGS